MFKINWKETITINKYAYIFLITSVLIMIISFLFKDYNAREEMQQILQNQELAIEEMQQAREERQQILQSQQRHERFHKESQKN